MTLQEFYATIGVDPTDVIKRFGSNEAMLKKFLNKFLSDTTFAQLEEAVQQKNWEVVFRTAHTLKGLSGNFDFKKIFDLSAKIVERYRANDYEPIPAMFEELKVIYIKTIDNLKILMAE